MTREVRTLSPVGRALLQRHEAELQACKLAALFAQELELPAGNMWEPAISRNIARDILAGFPLADVESDYRSLLGLDIEARDGRGPFATEDRARAAAERAS